MSEPAYFSAADVITIFGARAAVSALRLAGIRSGPNTEWCRYYVLVGYKCMARGHALIFKGSPTQHPSIVSFFLPARLHYAGPLLMPSPAMDFHPDLRSDDLICAIATPQEIEWAHPISKRTIDVSRYPSKCPVIGCGAPAYIGVVPTAVDCSSSTCRHHQT